MATVCVPQTSEAKLNTRRARRSEYRYSVTAAAHIFANLDAHNLYGLTATRLRSLLSNLAANALDCYITYYTNTDASLRGFAGDVVMDKGVMARSQLSPLLGFSRLFILYLLFSCYLVVPVSAFWRVLCHGHLGVMRIDPIADFGQVSPHAHTVHGASGAASSIT